MHLLRLMHEIYADMAWRVMAWRSHPACLLHERHERHEALRVPSLGPVAP
jgi:hypothetical protein